MYRKGIFSLISWLAISLPVVFSLLAVASANEVEPVQDTIMIFYPYHAILVSSGLFILFAGMICARYMKGRRWWLKAHKILGIGGAASTLTGIALAVYMVSASGGLIPPAGLHAYIGITVSFMVIFAFFMGFVQLKKRDKRLRAVHRWSGRITIALMIINVYLGWMIVQSF